MKRLSLKYCKAIACLSVFLLSSVCGQAQYYRHYHLMPHAVDYCIMNDIARQAMFDGIVLRDFSNEAICTRQCAAANRAAMAKLCAEEIAIDATGALAYDLLSLTDISDRGLRNAGIALTCAQIALGATAIHKAEQARKEAIEAQQQSDPEMSTEDAEQLEQIRKKENKALTTLAIIGAAAWTLDAFFGDYPRGPRYRYHHPYRRHYHPYY
ncbi:MAG: hypothetical protein J6W13_06940 [Salinivirgaceae bacterium]|nr:hypothetical protein [Salinivirgaceae bacterium]